MVTQTQVGTIQLAEGVFAFIQEGGATNGGFIVGDQGVLVVEGLMTKALALQLIGEVKRVTNKPIRFLVYTHFHGDHTYGGEHFLPAVVVGHKECREELFEKWDPWVNRFATNRPELADEFRKVKITPPDVVFTERLTLHLGSRRVELHYFGRAHTRGDAFIYLPQDRVVFSGDAVVNSRVPACMDGYVTSWISVLEQAQKLDIATLVPGHGLLGNKQTIADQHAFFIELKRQTRQAFEARKSQEEATRGLQLAPYVSWPGMQNLAVPVQRLYMEFQGQL